MMSFWKKLTGELIVDSNGHPILCDHCPCKTVIPAGTTITYTLTRTVTRAKDCKTEQTSNGQISISDRNKFGWTWTHKVNASYTTTADIYVREGVWIDLLDSTKGTASDVFEGSGNGTRTEWNPMTSTYDDTTYTATMQQRQDIPRVRAYLQPVDEGGTKVLKWTQYYCSHSWTFASDYSHLQWTPVPTKTQTVWIVALSEDSCTETVTGGTGEKGIYRQTITVASIDLETGQAVANLTANASCDFTEEFGTSTGTQKGTDSVTDGWTASWTMAMPPCENCQDL